MLRGGAISEHKIPLHRQLPGHVVYFDAIFKDEAGSQKRRSMCGHTK